MIFGEDGIFLLQVGSRIICIYLWEEIGKVLYEKQLML